jgi:hypothetical protein
MNFADLKFGKRSALERRELAQALSVNFRLSASVCIIAKNIAL